ncbi:MAG TPA: FCD domain-containing protein [Caulobacteraceae bacterium]|nr:FCD domain-containing protein [Caulobacteraceae bacterium]
MKTEATEAPPGGATRYDRAIRVPKAAELIAETIRRRVVQGDLTVGDALPSEVELMAEFHVSRASLREAFRILEAESLIEVKRGAHGGARITLPTDTSAAKSVGMLLQIRGATLREMFDARLVIEPPLVSQLASVRTEEHLAELRAHLDFETAHLSDWTVFARAAAEFHQLLARMAGNVTLALVVSMLDELYLRHLTRFVSRNRPDQLQLNQSALSIHRQLVETIAARDGASAETTWRYHMQQSRNVILAELGENTPLAVY